jgi:ribosomal subunit interface protein
MSKLKNILQIKYINVKPSDAITSYVQRKVAKHDAEAKELTALVCNINLESSKAGKTYCITLETAMTHSGFIVREKGSDIYKLIDDLSDKFRTRLVKMLDKQNDNPAQQQDPMWMDAFISDTQGDYNVAFDPGESHKKMIVERKKYFDNSPLHIEEAIEMMEMVGRPCFLFKNISTGKYAVVYKVDSGNGKRGYGLLEHRD